MSGARSGSARAAALLLLLGAAGCERGGRGGTDAHGSGFVDVTERSGIRFRHVNGASGAFYFIETNGSGLGFFDYDNDGDLDLYLVQGGALPGFKEPAGPFTSRLYRNDSGLRFTDVTDAAGCGATLYGTGCLLGDYDGDGWRDVFVYGFGPNVLYRNRGDGSFEVVTKRAGVGDARYAGAAVRADFDRDGDLDLFVGNYVKWSFELHQTCARPPASAIASPTSSTPSPTCSTATTATAPSPTSPSSAGSRGATARRSARSPATSTTTATSTCSWPNDSTPNFLYRNDGAPGELRFTDVSESASVAYNRDGATQGWMGVDCADIDGNLSQDLVVTNLQMEPNALYLNDGRGSFDEVSYERGIARPSVIDFGWGVRFLDFDDDGDPDLLVVNGHLHAGVARYDASQKYAQKPRLFLNDGRGRFTLAGAEGGPFLDEELVGRGLATADLDDDGDLDLAIGTNDHDARLIERAGRPARGWIGLELAGSGHDPDAIGARVDVIAGGRTQRQEVRGGASWASWNDLRLLFGLGDATSAERVVVRWPLGRIETFGPLAAGRYHRLVEGSGRAP